MAESPITSADLQRAMEDPLVQASSPANLIGAVSNILGIEDIDPVDQHEVEFARSIYFQAFRLERDQWTLMPGSIDGRDAYVQIIPFKLKWIPDNCNLVADVLIDKSDFERDVFDRCITGMGVRGKSIIFYAANILPIDLVLGLKCVDDLDTVVRVPEECYRAKRG